MKTLNKLTLLFGLILFLSGNLLSQIYVPEGLNIPGNWDNWNNPPTNLVFASSAQAGGDVHLITETNNYQTIFSTPTNVAAGSYEFLFSSGPSSNYWQNKWNDVTISLNTIQTYTLNGTNDNSITVSNDKWYTMNFENTGYADTRAIFMETSGEPVTISSVSHSPTLPVSTQDVTVNIDISASKSAEEKIYVRYTTDDWTSSTLAEASFTGTSGTATIPMQVDNTNVKYYVFTTTKSNPTADFDLYTINFKKNGTAYFEYTVGVTPSCEGQTGVVTTDPVFPLHDGSVTITFNAQLGNGALAGYVGDVYAHTGVITSESSGNNDWRYVRPATWGTNNPEEKFTNIGTDLYQLTIPNIRDFYGVPAGEEIQKIAMVIRAGEPITPTEPNNFLVARNADGSDIHIDVYDAGLHVKILSPSSKDPLTNPAELVPVCVAAMDASSISIEIDGSEVESATGVDELTHIMNSADYGAGQHMIVSIASDAKATAKDTVYFYIRPDVQVQDLPAGMKPGINYGADNTSITFVLQDPVAAKQYAFVIGDFNEWTVNDAGYMKKTPDGKYWWATITGLTSGTEYSYQYYIDGTLKIADPYADKILDPWNDRYIPETTYPNLKTYPWDMTLGTVSVCQPGQTDYVWQVPNFTPVAVNETQSNLIIYELLIRDFVESRDIKDVQLKLDYLQSLGINAIELLPISEFEGNDSWGYAPNFYYAPDKAYGTKNDYKAFIDACHQKGIAVIMDVVYNHMYGGSPFVQMYWDSENNKPAANNPWFNQDATHPFSIGYDLNHESSYTDALVKDNLTYWMTEYKIDGFRFDLSKGFTQNNTGGDIGAWSAYDQSRIDIIEDYYNHVKSVNSNAYFILEHLADNDEETVLANAGCLMWGVMNEKFNQATMGHNDNHDFSWAIYSERGFSYPNLIPYMESHDEERLMYRNLEYGNSSGSYDVKDLPTALSRIEEIVPFYYGIPGPKMVWQFGELGYDESIFLCGDGSYSDDCRTSAKPVHWEYMTQENRRKVYQSYANMANLKTKDGFRTGSFSHDLSGLGKREWISNSGGLNVVIAGNFDVTAFSMAPGFQHTGTWYDYYTGESFDVSDASGHSVYFEPGDFHVYTDQYIATPDIPSNVAKNNKIEDINIYPNPTNGIFQLDFPTSLRLGNLIVTDITGKTIYSSRDITSNVYTIDISNQPTGIYFIKIQTENSIITRKLIKQ